MLSRKITVLTAGSFVMVCLVTWSLVSVVKSQPLASRPDTPSVDFIAAAMQDQVAKRGASLEARYTTQLGVGADRHGDSMRIKYRYVWTPGVMFVRKDYESSSDSVTWASRSTKITRYDAVARRHRMLWTSAGGNGAFGRDVSGVPNDDWSTLEKMETACRYFYDAPLYEAIRKGAVGAEQEEINGFACWKVDILLGASEAQELHYVVWCDPAIGFCPRRLAVTLGGGSTHTAELTDYRDLGDGLWFPGKVDVKASTSNGSTRCVSTLEDVQVGRAVPAAELAVTFPSGTHVEVGDPTDPVITVVP